MLIQFYAEKLLFKPWPGPGPWSLVLTLYLLLSSPACKLVRERDRVGGRFPAGLWQQRTRGSIYKIDVVLSASQSYCGNHIPIFTKNKTPHLPPPPPASAPMYPHAQIFLFRKHSEYCPYSHIFQHQIWNFTQYLQESVMVFPPWHTSLSVFAPVALITNSQDSWLFWYCVENTARPLCHSQNN